MNVIKVTPRGYCFGVVKSIKMAKDAIKNYPGQQIYMLGFLVHNHHVVNEITNLGIIPINDFKQDRLAILQTLPNNSVVVLSAHGSHEKIKDVAQAKNIILIDTECEWVTATKDLIKEYLTKDYEIIFIGKDYHPETNAIMSIDSRIHLVTTLANVDKIIDKVDPHKPILVTNQTTLSKIDIEEIVNKLKNIFGNRILFKNDLCNATLERQNAVLNLNPHEVQLLLVVGDERSNNTNKLVEMGESINIKSYRINDKNDINPGWLTNVTTVAVTAGASTPSLLQLEVIKYLENLP
ncbi:4-hydroxy-3-methylbut-2-enyl diphosphate reductase [Spiroplasma eriocheiris]|uniref:4-hydroxy-3-methylbut-2-enyl diphosphate reductase n=1 Tax=Spiroplasma eriocheiris TaxID=315358 RepID=A0A0H3XMW7_9MOLU|nr:4-hydroxy-3-methylbut-2-enyl diphosphate reductase [Spiroplasma eriocheiris]AHF57975.1 putative 4-hydroxy-3-methylbut-2-enyl diphosphate reductase [Spiroplasma eriocheiris CCTCC M 207170]AKM54417.1 4-hydroxy-3-methylbut-2-enyl diphosphate reductase [Spiroplasma eriocheiris]